MFSTRQGYIMNRLEGNVADKLPHAFCTTKTAWFRLHLLRYTKQLIVTSIVNLKTPETFAFSVSKTCHQIRIHTLMQS